MANRTRTNRNEFHLDDKEQFILDEKFKPVSYTHLDVYKRQVLLCRKRQPPDCRLYILWDILA